LRQRRPDLIVANLSFDSQGAVGAGDNLAAVSATITNQGAGDAALTCSPCLIPNPTPTATPTITPTPTISPTATISPTPSV
jgi:hypothetical protein